MCTAFTLYSKEFYFGRNFDWEYSFGEEIVVTPRNYCFKFSDGLVSDEHYSIIGTALVKDDYPLYFDGMNEKGLVAAGLNFPGNAVYNKPEYDKTNITSYEFIPYILTRFSTVSDVVAFLREVNITGTAFSESLKPSPLHWIIADKYRCFTIEPVSEGLRIYENPLGVLTNNPVFPYHMHNVANYMKLSPDSCVSKAAESRGIEPYSLGLGAYGLPGDWSSASRFVRAFFEKTNITCGDTDEETISEVFHILDSCLVPRGCVHLDNGNNQYTRYSACFNNGIYYYTTYENRQINAVDMKAFDLDTISLIRLPFVKKQNMFCQV